VHMQAGVQQVDLVTLSPPAKAHQRKAPVAGAGQRAAWRSGYEVWPIARPSLLSKAAWLLAAFL